MNRGDRCKKYLCNLLATDIKSIDKINDVDLKLHSNTIYSTDPFYAADNSTGNTLCY